MIVELWRLLYKDEKGFFFRKTLGVKPKSYTKKVTVNNDLIYIQVPCDKMLTQSLENGPHTYGINCPLWKLHT